MGLMNIMALAGDTHQSQAGQVWLRTCVTLKRELGDATFGSWVAQAAVLEEPNGGLGDPGAEGRVTEFPLQGDTCPQPDLTGLRLVRVPCERHDVHQPHTPCIAPPSTANTSQPREN